MRIPAFSIWTAALLLSSVVSNIAAAQEVWKWVDKNGVTHYSDQPAPGAVKVDIHVQTYELENDTFSKSAPTSPSKRAAADVYQSVRISRPSNEETIVGTGGQVVIAAEIDPGLQPGHSVALEMDGQQVSAPNSKALSITLDDVPRGTHTASVSVLAANGSTVVHSEAVTFYVRVPMVKRPK